MEETKRAAAMAALATIGHAEAFVEHAHARAIDACRQARRAVEEARSLADVSGADVKASVVASTTDILAVLYKAESDAGDARDKARLAATHARAKAIGVDMSAE